MDPRILARIVSETRLVGRYGLTALNHPVNHLYVSWEYLLNSGSGLRFACDLGDPSCPRFSRFEYMFHESQLDRILRRYNSQGDLV
jgi:hypothetical protein